MAEAESRNGSDKSTLRREISDFLIQSMRAAEGEGDETLANALMLFGAAVGVGTETELLEMARNPEYDPNVDGLPIKSIHELEADYRQFCQRSESVSLHLNRWLPSLATRPLVPGELVVIVSDTGVGKTALMQNIARHASPLPVLMFQLELPGSLLFERYAQMTSGHSGDAVFQAYRNKTKVPWNERELAHVWTCDRSGLKSTEIESLIRKSSVKIGKPPAVVMVDYIGLIAGTGAAKRYERVSDAAENLKVIAKKLDTILICASQLARPDDREEVVEPRLHHAKDSGSIESSAGLVLGAWRSKEDKSRLMIKVLKNTKGASGKIVTCKFDFRTMTIRELAKEEQNE